MIHHEVRVTVPGAPFTDAEKAALAAVGYESIDDEAAAVTVLAAAHEGAGHDALSTAISRVLAALARAGRDGTGVTAAVTAVSDVPVAVGEPGPDDGVEPADVQTIDAGDVGDANALLGNITG